MTYLEILAIVGIWFLNLGISYLNARVCAASWVETKATGGFPRVGSWLVAIMATSGFFWCFGIVEAGGLYAFNQITFEQLKLVLELGYLMIAPGVIGIGIVFTVQSWAVAFRRRNYLDYGVAVYNTWATYQNVSSAITAYPQALADVFSAFGGGGKNKSSSSSDSKDDNNGAQLLVVLVIVLGALLLAIATTAAIIKKHSGQHELPSNGGRSFHTPIQE